MVRKDDFSFWGFSRADEIDIDDVDVKESQRDEELIGPFDIDGILPVNVVNI